MSNVESVDACRSRIRMTSVIAAVVVGLVVWLVLGLGFWIALILGVIAYFVLSWFLEKSCKKAAEEAAAADAARAQAERAAAAKEAEASVSAAPEAKAAAPVEVAAPAPAAPAPSEPAPAPVVDEDVSAGTETHWSAGVAAQSGKASEGRGQSALKPSATLADEDTLRDGVGAWRYEGAADAPAPATASEDAEPAPAPVAADAAAVEEQPTTLSAARDGGADDLKRIKGVGPGLEKTLNELGFYHFDQIAAWTDAEVEWVDARLKFKGRIVRDNWIDQARAFAQGG